MRTASRVQRKGPMTFVLSTALKRSRENSSVGVAGALIPAFYHGRCLACHREQEGTYIEQHVESTCWEFRDENI